MNRITSEKFNGKHARSNGFTIIELLAVLAIIAIFLSVFGLALTRGDETAGIEASQRTMSALLSGARGQAVMHQEAVYVLVSADENHPESFLRNVQLVRSRGFEEDITGAPLKDGYGNDIPIVRAVGNSSQLGRGTYIVPSREMADRLSSNAQAMLGEYDQVLQQNGLTLAERQQRTSSANYGEVFFEADNKRENYLYFRIDERGFSSNGHRIVFAPGQRGPNTVRFDNPDVAVGFLVRPFGSVVMISDPRGFYEN